MVNWTMAFTIIKVILIELFTYLVANSQDFFRLFPHEKNVAIAVDSVHPVPCVFWLKFFYFL